LHTLPLKLQPANTKPLALIALMAQPPTLVPALPATVLLARTTVLLSE
jgi:hypothetical protein